MHDLEIQSPPTQKSTVRTEHKRKEAILGQSWGMLPRGVSDVLNGPTAFH